MDSEKKIYRLSQVTASIEKAVQRATGGNRFWILCEISAVNVATSGHVYFQLVEERNSAKLAQLSAIMWKNDYARVKDQLGSHVQDVLKVGNEVVFEGKVTFHSVFGLKLHFTKVDLEHTIGALELRKQKTIEELKANELFDLNKQVKVPLVMQRIAVVASSTSAGLKDFYKQLEEDDTLNISIQLFDSQVQGATAAASMLTAYSRIEFHKFDCVVFIRGGGSKLDLDCFNDYDLCSTVATCPLPVITGIGHETDTSVLDMIVRLPQKTPTAASAFLVQRIWNQLKEIGELSLRLNQLLTDRFESHKHQLLKWTELTSWKPINQTQLMRGALFDQSQKLERRVTDVLQSSSQLLEQYQHSIPGILSEYLNKSHKNIDDQDRILAESSMNTVHTEKEALMRSGGKLERLVVLRLNDSQGELRKMLLQLEHRAESSLDLRHRAVLKDFERILAQKSLQKLDFESNLVSIMGEGIELMGMDKSLRRGFSITRKNGKAVLRFSDLEEGDVLITELHDGIVESVVQSIKKGTKDERTKFNLRKSLQRITGYHE